VPDDVVYLGSLPSNCAEAASRQHGSAREGARPGVLQRRGEALIRMRRYAMAGPEYGGGLLAGGDLTVLV